MNANLAGSKFGRWTILGFHSIKHASARMLCRCECGKEKIIYLKSMKSGDSTNCGCQRNIVHGNAKRGSSGKTKEYTTWCNMLRRCFDENNEAFYNYGERGIMVCDRWADSFASFLEDMGKSPSRQHTIDRIDNDGNYEPGNCRWATRKEQNRNSRNCLIIEHEGKAMTLVEWSELVGISTYVISWRIKSGWTTKEALFTPTLRRGKLPRHLTAPSTTSSNNLTTSIPLTPSREITK